MILVLVSALLLSLVGCGGSKEDKTADTATETTGTVSIADDRIVGSWEGEDGKVEFKDDGTIVLDDGTAFPFSMPNSDALEIAFPDGPREYSVTWEGDDRHGVVSKDSTDTTPTWYDRAE
jgi:hypothetical protein